MPWWRSGDNSDEPRISAGEAMGLVGLGADPAAVGGLVHHRDVRSFDRALVEAPNGAGGRALAEEWGLGEWGDADVSDAWYPQPVEGSGWDADGGAVQAWGWSG